MANNYDRIAKYYDRLSRLVFNDAQISIQVSQLAEIPSNSSILIVGGGSGWILEELYVLHPQGLTITYVESSAKMMSLAQGRQHYKNEIHFVNLGIEDFEPASTFDVLMTAFLFDNFRAEKAAVVFSRLHHLLRPGGYWLYSDFSFNAQKKSLWQRMLLKVMYLFFRQIAHVEADQLSNILPEFKANGYHTVTQQHAFYGFMESYVFRR